MGRSTTMPSTSGKRLKFSLVILTDAQRCNHVLACTKNMLLAQENTLMGQWMVPKTLKERSSRSGLAVVSDSCFSSFPYLMSSWSLNLDQSLGWGKRKRSGRNAVCTAASASPSSPKSQSLNTDHAESTNGLVGERSKTDTCRRSRRGSEELPCFLGIRVTLLSQDFHIYKHNCLAWKLLSFSEPRLYSKMYPKPCYSGPPIYRG